MNCQQDLPVVVGLSHVLYWFLHSIFNLIYSLLLWESSASTRAQFHGFANNRRPSASGEAAKRLDRKAIVNEVCVHQNLTAASTSHSRSRCFATASNPLHLRQFKTEPNTEQHPITISSAIVVTGNIDTDKIRWANRTFA